VPRSSHQTIRHPQVRASRRRLGDIDAIEPPSHLWRVPEGRRRLWNRATKFHFVPFASERFCGRGVIHLGRANCMRTCNAQPTNQAPFREHHEQRASRHYSDGLVRSGHNGAHDRLLARAGLGAEPRRTALCHSTLTLSPHIAAKSFERLVQDSGSLSNKKKSYPKASKRKSNASGR
jgi:hypothetical protein